MRPILILTMVISVGSKELDWPTVIRIIICVLASTFKSLHNYFPAVTRSIFLQEHCSPLPYLTSSVKLDNIRKEW